VKICEHKIATGGKRSRTLFDGFVLSISATVPTPEFSLVRSDQTEPRFLGRPMISPPGDPTGWQGFSATGKGYSLWLSPGTGAEGRASVVALAERLVKLDQRFERDVTLYSAIRRWGRITVALQHRGDLFRLGGLFATRARLNHQITACYGDLTLSLSVASELLDAQSPVPATADLS
jgi:hypothetical protein